MTSPVRRMTLLLLLTALTLPATAQEQENLNLYYRYPIALAGEFHTWTPFADYAGSYNVLEAGGSVRVPIPRAPLFQPLIRGAWVQFDSLDEQNPTQWDHYHVSAGAGLALVNRLARNFEVGAELSGGYSRTVYPNIASEPVGYGAVLGAFAPRISLVPSFNLAITVQPTIRYTHAFGPVDRFNGLSFSVGVGGEFRLGQDPDSAQTQIRSLRISQPQVDTVFAAMQSYYVNNPVGTVVLENTESFAVEDVRVSFFQNGYMDSATPSARIEEIGPGEQVSVDLLASYNAAIFELEGVTPLTGEVIVSYASRGRPAEQRESVTYDLHDKTALTWTDDRKMGSFITPADSAIRNYTSFIRQAGSSAVVDSASENLQIAMVAYHALAEIGVIYQIDPTSPFTEVQNNTAVVDSVSLPRDTLTRLAGDCDDLTALYASMLETVGIETAFITTPGHIYVAFNTGVPARDYLIVHPDRDMLLTIDDRIWIPVEVTMLGSGNFLDAWRFGVDEWKKLDATPENRDLIRTRAAQSVFRPVGLRETDLGLQYGSPERIRQAFEADFTRLANTILADVRERAERRNNERAYNQLGIYAARLGQYGTAQDAFQRAARLDSTYLDPRINLGSVLFLQEEYERAARAFQEAANAAQLSSRVEPELVATVYINLSKSYFELGQYEVAQGYFQRAADASPENTAEFEYLAQAASSGARASEAQSGPPILFADVRDDE